MQRCLIIATVVLLCGVSTGRGYRILCYTPLPSKSHDRLAWGIVRPLLQAGHEITWVTPYPDRKIENLTIVDVSATIKIVQDLDMVTKRLAGIDIAKTMSGNITDIVFAGDLRRVLKENQYDAVVSEWFFSDIEAGLAAVQRVPWILLSGVVMHSHLESLVDTIRTTATIPTLISNPCITPMTFWQRLQNTKTQLLMSFDNWLNFNTAAAKYEAIYKPIAEARGVSLPPYSVAVHDVSILLVNDHPSFAPAQSLPPNVVHVGGYHIDEEIPPLPKDLQELLDSSRQGVVFFSMGSVLKSAAFPEQTKKDIIEVLGSIPYTVLWKFEEKIENLPKNVHVRSWMPQMSILAHPNVKLFISHCGLLSTLEAIHNGVPMLAIPMFGDQPGNADRAETTGYAVKINFEPDMKEEFKRGLEEMLSNDRYYKKDKYVSMLFRNRVVPPSKLITHYVELAIQSGGAHHLRSTARLYAWYQLWMLDQLAAALLALVTAYTVLKKIISLFIKNESAIKKKDKKKKLT